MDIQSVYIFNRNLNFVPLISIFGLYFLLLSVKGTQSKEKQKETKAANKAPDSDKIKAS